MEATRLYGKFFSHQNRIKALEKSSSRFKRIFSEYEFLFNELRNLETAEGPAITEEFLDSIKLQTAYLEDEVEDWLLDDFLEVSV